MSKEYVDEATQDRIFTKFNTILVGMYNESKSGTEFRDKIEEKAAEARINRSQDGVSLTGDSDEFSFDEKRKEYANLYARFANSKDTNESNQLLSQLTQMEKDFPELQNDGVVDQILSQMTPQQATQKAIEHTAKELEENKRQADSVYNKKESDGKPASKETVEQSFGSKNIDLNDLGRKIEDFADDIVRREEPKMFREACQKAAQKEWADTDKVAYRKNTYESNGKTVEYTQAAQKVDWGKWLDEASKSGNTSQEYNIERLRVYVSRQIYDYFGGFNRITSIVVRSQQLIINNVCYMPLIDRKYLNDASMFPLDSLDYLKSGCIAPLFNWKYLRKMKKLTLLDIDDTDFYLTDIASDIGAGRRAGLTTIFNLIPSLEVFILGGDIVREDEINTEQGRVVKEKIAKHKHFINFSDGYKLNIYSGTNGVQNWTLNNLKSYANNRGNKGIFRFTGGILSRSVVAGLAGIVNLGAHFIGGMFQVGKQIFTDATTDVTPEDLN